MKRQIQNLTSRQKSIYTLAQNESEYRHKKPVLLKGTGSDLNQTRSIKGKAKRKLISQTIALQLIDIAKELNNTENEKAFWNVYHCQSTVFTKNRRLHGNYCKSHICPLCSANRKAIMINQYKPIISSWTAPYFLTLTSRSVKAKYLKRNLDGTIRALSKILASQRQKAKRGKGNVFIGIRSIECNFNPIKQTYNPHIHLLLPDKETAENLKSEWLKIWTSKHTVDYAQYLRPVTDTEEDLIEVIKYGSKIFVDPTMSKSKKKKIPPIIYIKALYNIFDAMKSKRLIQNFGFNLPKLDEAKEAPTLCYDAKEWCYSIKEKTWISTDSGKPLFEPEIDPMVEFLLSNNTNKTSY